MRGSEARAADARESEVRAADASVSDVSESESRVADVSECEAGVTVASEREARTNDEGNGEARVGEESEVRVADVSGSEVRVADMSGNEVRVSDEDKNDPSVNEEGEGEARVNNEGENELRVTDDCQSEASWKNEGESEARVNNEGRSEARENNVGRSEVIVNSESENEARVDNEGESEVSGSEAATETRASVAKQLQVAILMPNPTTLRALLDRHGSTVLTQQPTCDEEESWTLHLLAKSGEDYAAPRCPPPPRPSTTCLTFRTGPQGENDPSNDPNDDLYSSPTHPPWVWAADTDQERRHRARMTLVHMLVDAGVDVNGRDAAGLTSLHYAARRGDAPLCDALVQCGADLDARHCGVTLYDEVAEAAVVAAEEASSRVSLPTPNHPDEQQPLPQDEAAPTNHQASPTCPDHQNPTDHRYGNHHHSGPTQDQDGPRAGCGPASFLVYRVLRFYWPGLWRAVATQDISKVRQLVNSWCRVELVKGGVSLGNLAMSTGNEALISLLVNILPSMSLVHHTLAGDAWAVRDLLESPARKKINIDIRKLSERGAPLLYFPIRAGHVDVVRELRRHGASLYTQMLDDDMVDVPVIFAALEPWMEPEVVKSLLPVQNSREARLLERVWYRGKNVLRQAVERGVHIDAIEAILEVGGAALLSERDPSGLTTLDYCLTHDFSALVTLFDLHVAAWLTRPDLYPARRDLLALRGYGRLEEVGVLQVELGQDVTPFLQEYRRCQGVLGEMFAAVREGEGGLLHHFIHFHSNLFHLVDLLWQGRLERDGMTLLHWAVLHGREDTVDLILQAPHAHPAQAPAHTLPSPTLTTRFSVDDIRDGWGRTPLHYAAGLVEGRGIEAALLHHGCSEHTLDMDGREPLDFKDARGSPALATLLHNLRNKNHSAPQPDPWDPDTLRAHLNHLRHQRFTTHHHHTQQSHHHTNPNQAPATPYVRQGAKTGPPYPYPAHFPTAPGSNFHWPLPRPLSPPARKEKVGQRVCCLM